MKPNDRTLLTPTLQKIICATLAEVHTVTTACARAGIAERTFHDWMQRGEREDRGRYRSFFNAVSHARARAKAKLVRQIVKAGEREWRAAAWTLERLFPNEYGAKNGGENEALQGGDIGMRLVLNTTKPLAKLLDFPRIALADKAGAAENASLWQSMVEPE